MKAVVCSQFGLPDTLQVLDIPSPIPSSKQVVISVEACGVNFPDVLIIQNKYQFTPELPFSPGGEVAGTIVELGDEVQGLELGQRVLALCGWGGFAEKVAVDLDRVFPLPPGLSAEVAATTLYTYGTSYHALKDRAQLQAGETLLVLGAAGGVGLAAVEPRTIKLGGYWVTMPNAGASTDLLAPKRRIKCWALALATSRTGMRMVVNPGPHQAMAGESLKPTTDKSAGTAVPCRRKASKAPSVPREVEITTAVGRGVWVSNCAITRWPLAASGASQNTALSSTGTWAACMVCKKPCRRSWPVLKALGPPM